MSMIVLSFSKHVYRANQQYYLQSFLLNILSLINCVTYVIANFLANQLQYLIPNA